MDDKKLCVAMFTNNYLPFIGGVPISIKRLTESLRRKGHTVYIFAPAYDGDAAFDDPYTIRIDLLTQYRDNDFKFGIVNAYSYKIEREFKARRFDIIHVHHPFWMGTRGLKLGKKYGVPVVMTFHTRFDNYEHYIPFMRKIFKNVISHDMIQRFANQCAAVFSPTETTKAYLEGVGVGAPITVLPTGVEMEAYEGSPDKRSPDSIARRVREQFVPDGGFLLCSVSRLTVEKNILFLIEGIKRVKEMASEPFTCIIIGEGPERGQAEEAIADAGLRDTVYLLGDVRPDEMAGHYLAADLFVFASKSETQGMVLLEAMAGGCPVVAVSATGVDDMITDGYNGYRAPEDATEWAKRVVALLCKGKKTRLARMSRNAYAYAASFSTDELAERAVAVYLDVLEKGGDRRD